MSRDKFILYLTQQIDFTRDAIRDQSVCPNLRVRIGLESKIAVLKQLEIAVRCGQFDDHGLSCNVSSMPNARELAVEKDAINSIED